jgi:hypothetical protein
MSCNHISINKYADIVAITGYTGCIINKNHAIEDENALHKNIAMY